MLRNTIAIAALSCGIGCGVPASVSDSYPCAADSRFTGRVVLEGVLTKGKGGQLVLQGNLVDLPVTDGSEGLKDSAANKSWYGKTVKVEGDRCVQICEPDAQCFGGGYLRNEVVIEVR